MEFISKIIDFLNKLRDVLVPVITVALLLGIIFGPETSVVGDIYTNFTEILSMLGEDALLALVSIVIILSYLKKD
jgi:purine-cytosine permease-like protein|tara:strand:- start:109 stop:333 length:225 start_codon:yes stop_codon:yes gene_type:complete